MSTEFTFVRHGQTDANAQGIYTGALDFPLNETGIKQAKEAGERLRETCYDVCIYGPSQRVMLTAQMILGALVKKPAVVLCRREAREMDFGLFDGYTAEENAKRHPVEWEEYMRDWVHFQFPGGESFRSFCKETGQFIEALHKEYTGKKLLIVASKGFILCAAALLLGEDINHIFDRPVENAQPVVVRV